MIHLWTGVCFDCSHILQDIQGYHHCAHRRPVFLSRKFGVRDHRIGCTYDWRQAYLFVCNPSPRNMDWRVALLVEGGGCTMVGFYVRAMREASLMRDAEADNQNNLP
jgi:hypothetical protein